MKMSQVLAMKKERGHQAIYEIDSQASLMEFCQSLCDKNVGAMLVREHDSEPPKYIGIISERDILKACCRKGLSLDAPVSNAMTSKMVVAKSTDDVEYVMRVMTKKHIRHIPLLDESVGNRIVGFLSIRDLLYADLDEKDITIQHLNDFLGGTYGNQVF